MKFIILNLCSMPCPICLLLELFGLPGAFGYQALVILGVCFVRWLAKVLFRLSYVVIQRNTMLIRPETSKGVKTFFFYGTIFALKGFLLAYVFQKGLF